MSGTGPDMPGVLPFGPAHILVAGSRWTSRDAFRGLEVDLQFPDGRAAGALCFAARGARSGLAFDEEQRVSRETLETLRTYMLRECGVNAMVAQDAMEDLLDTLREILADVPLPHELRS